MLFVSGLVTIVVFAVCARVLKHPSTKMIGNSRFFMVDVKKAIYHYFNKCTYNIKIILRPFRINPDCTLIFECYAS